MRKSIGILLLTASLLVAENISIGPAPVSSDTIVGTGNESRLDVSTLSYTTDSMDLSAVGVGFGTREKYSGGAVFDGSANLMVLSGTFDGGSLSGVSMGANLLIGTEIKEDLLIYVGPTLSMMSMDIVAGSLDIWTSIMMYGLKAGIQYELKTSFGTISPWYFMSSMQGTSSSTTSGYVGSYYVYQSSDSDIDAMMTTQLGFDMYFNDLGASLSTMMQSNSDGDMISFTYSFKI